MERPILGITMGDPAGCGPEISVKALADENIYKKTRPLVIGDVHVMNKAVALVGMEDTIQVNQVEKVEDARFEPGIIDVYHMDLVDIDSLEYGRVSAMAGDAAFQSVRKAIELALEGEIDATVTNALNKEAINLAGHHFSGHTEIYAHYTNTEKYTMMLAHGTLRVVHVSTHVSLRDACDAVKKERVLDVIEIAHRACRALGIEKPRIAVAGLNPHCGENGMFGTEEIEEIEPAVKEACEKGIIADGPIAPDTVFSKARGGMYDIVAAMYHDQGHIPLKIAGFVYNQEKKEWNAVEGVNITLGLPIIRTSVDHGTAFGHAGKGNADEKSLVNAIDYAVVLAKNR